jgi:hypothetical protein
MNGQDGSTGQAALAAWLPRLCTPVSAVLAQGFFATSHYFSGHRIDDLFEVLVVFSVNNLNLVHPAPGFMVQIITREALHNWLFLAAAFKLVPEAALHRHSVCDAHFEGHRLFGRLVSLGGQSVTLFQFRIRAKSRNSAPHSPGRR